ncbi:LysR family transcriptional regulator [Sphingomonas sp. BLCC-B65]|nr:LysR family transcriptional regulator [Sphingomonas sp. BLCC-B65]
MDLNLLRPLQALLEETSVTKAAERLRTSSAAMSRTLARLRIELDDPLLVRAGRTLVPTPFALQLRAEVDEIVRRTDSLSRTDSTFDPATTERVFTVQIADLFLAGVAARLLALLRAEAPGVGIIFRPETIEGGQGLRDGSVDVEIGVLDHIDVEVMTLSMATVPLAGIARASHPLFDRTIDAETFADASHISVSRRGKRRGPIDDALAARGLRRRVASVIPSHTGAMLTAAASDLVSIVPAGWLEDVAASLALRTFEIPLDLPPLDIGMAWHPRMSADAGHRWLRSHLRDVFAHHA